MVNNAFITINLKTLPEIFHITPLNKQSEYIVPKNNYIISEIANIHGIPGKTIKICLKTLKENFH